MKRKIFFLFLSLVLLVGMAMPAAADSGAQAAADTLYALGLFKGTGTLPDGSQNYELDRAPSRQEAVTMLVRLLGKEAEAVNGSWETPFTDVADWAEPYVGYAYAKGLTQGTGASTFGGSQTVTAAQYLTFVLRALGYVSGEDFDWDAAWDLTDALGFTAREYSAENNSSFLRGDAVKVSAAAMAAAVKDSSQTLIERLVAEGAVTQAAAEASGLLPDVYTLYARELLALEGEHATLTLDEGVTVTVESLAAIFGIRDTWKEDVDLYRVGIKNGDVAEALASALRSYVDECLDGNYDDKVNVLSNHTYGGMSGASLILFTNAKGTILGIGTRTGSEQDFNVVLLKEDSRLFVDERVAEIDGLYDSLTKLSCRAEMVDGQYLYHFEDLPENAVWMEPIFSTWQSEWLVEQGKRPVDASMKDRVVSYQSKLLYGTRPTLAAQADYTEEAVYTDSAYRENAAMVYRGFVFLDANYQLIAYSIAELPVK